MNKSKAIICLSFLITIIKMNAIGGGVFLYRYNLNKEVEFLFVLDPHQLNQARIGFEYPGGTIGDKPVDGLQSSTNKDNPYNFLLGSIRELLEELVFYPAFIFNHPTKYSVISHDDNKTPIYNEQTKKINTRIEEQIIKEIAEHIKQQNGLFFIYKHNASSQTPPIPDDKTAVFFLDISNNYDAHDAPQTIRDFRKLLNDRGFKFQDIDAEPCAFAWVKGNDLLPHLDNPTNPVWIKQTSYAQDQKSSLANVFQNGNILISRTAIGMMRNREKDHHNPQPNIVCQKNAKGAFVLFDQNGNFIQEATSQPPIISSSMSAIIKTLQNPDNHKYFSKQQLPKTTPLTSAEKTTMLTKALELASILKP